MAYRSQTEIANNNVAFEATKTVEYTSNQTSTKILTPSSGMRLKVVRIKIETKATTGQVKLYDDKSGEILAILNAENNGSGDYEMRFVGSIDSSIEVTSTTGSNSVFILINYDEVDGPTKLTSTTSTSTSTTTTSTSTTTTSTSTSTS